MDAPSPDLATHLIRVTPVTVAQDADFGMDPTYDPAAAVGYIGIVEQSGQGASDDGVIYSIDGFTVTIFAAVDPAIVGPLDGRPVANQSQLEWSKLPAGFPLPPRGAAGPVDVPGGWIPEKTALALGDSNALDVGCWTARAEARS